MRITKFSQITAQLPYPAKYKGVLQSIHSTVITAALKSAKLSRSEANRIIKIINIISWRCLHDEDLGWVDSSPLTISGDVDDDDMQSYLGSMYVISKYIDWSQDDIELITNSSIFPTVTTTTSATSTVVSTDASINTKETAKESLYIQPPVIPQFDYTKVYASGTVDECQYVIYKSLPIIPTTQNEVSITTDVGLMSEYDLLRLFPKQRIKTRAASLYESVPTLDHHDLLGNILPIEGYTKDQLIDNLVKYPHLYKLAKQVDGDVVSFYTSIEIDGELHNISDIWRTLPEASVIPYQKDYIKEYVVRRYLLERDVHNIKHKYPMYGTLDPYLTLFTSIEEYAALGYTDAENIARMCVEARVSYKMSRNPVLRRLGNV